MKKILFLVVLFTTVPFLGRSEDSGVAVKTGDVEVEMKLGTPDKDTPVVIIEKPVIIEKTPVIVDKTTVVQPTGGCSLDYRRTFKKI